MIQTLDDPRVMEAAMTHLSRADPVMRRLVQSQGRIDFEPKGMAFRWLVRSILSQQLNGNAASMIISRVNRLFLPGRVTPEKLALVPPARLRRAGVSP
ncbi:MAG: hypothetical protein LYZ69_05655 [Nitrososphaerales archaeon]|nr:hypothetical protein [Nitrososphaerales archaeon]